MPKKYCFKIHNKDNSVFDTDELKNFVETLYVGTGDNKFSSDKPLPFVVIYIPEEQNVCILMKSTAKKNLVIVETNNSIFNKSQLRWKKNIYLDKPFEYTTDVHQWWDDEAGVSDLPKGDNWKSLQHRGPYFTHLMEPYQPIGLSLSYDGKKYLLTPEEEKVALLYAKRKVTDITAALSYTTNEKFNNHFWKDFKKYLTPEHKKIFKNFSKIDWKDIITHVEDTKGKKLTKEEKVRKDEMTHAYKYAYIDGRREEVGNFIVEQQGIFLGRGENPNSGKIKLEINPEDVIINIGKNDPIPKAPKGHKWGKVIHNPKVKWLASWKEMNTGKSKTMLFANFGTFKSKSDLAKFEIARKLQFHIETVRENYETLATSKDIKQMQLGTVLYLIDNYGIRVGNEREKGEAEDIVGASTLKVGNVNLLKDYKIQLHFTGKDSIAFNQILKLSIQIYHNMEKLVKGKKETADLFNNVSSTTINEYLKHFDQGFSAKVFRTRVASELMYNALSEVTVPKGSKKAEIKALFGGANKKIATVLNHSRTPTKKQQEKIAELEIKLKDLLSKVKSRKATVQEQKSIDSLNTQLKSKKDNLDVAMGTSLTNYIDPRIVVAWTKEQGIDLDAIYTSTNQKKFTWAEESTDKNWEWPTSPLVISSELQPSVGEAIPKPKPKPKPKPATPKPKPATPKPKPATPKPKPATPKPKPATPQLDENTIQLIDEFIRKQHKRWYINPNN